MRLASLSTLLVAAVLAAPALWHGFAVHDLDPTTALRRFLIAVPVAWVMLLALRAVVNGYRRDEDEDGAEPAERPPLRVEAVTGEPMPQRRATDQPEAAAE